MKTVVRVKPQDCRIVRIRNTLALSDIQVSEPLLAMVRSQPERFEVVGDPAALAFDANGALPPLIRTPHAQAA